MAKIQKFEVGCPSCQRVIQPETPYKTVSALLLAAILGFIGFAIGSVVGVATAGVGFVAWIFTVPLGLYFGYKSGGWGAELVQGVICPACEYHF